MKIWKSMLVVVGLVLLCGGAAQAANTVSGSLWHVTSAAANNAIPANVPGTTPDVTFSVFSPLNFDSYSGYTVGGWLATGGAFNIVENTANTLVSSFNDTLMYFTGQVTVNSGQQFTVAHDDGLTLIIGGLTVINAPGPTSPAQTTGTYTGPSGTLPFELVYAECCGAPAVLQVDLPFTSAVPEPATMLLLGFGLLGLAGMRRVKK